MFEHLREVNCLTILVCLGVINPPLRISPKCGDIRVVILPGDSNHGELANRHSRREFRVCDANGVSIGTAGVVTGSPAAPVLVAERGGTGAVDETVYSTFA